MTCQRVVQPDQLAAPCFVAACPVAVADGAQSGDLGFRLQSAQRVGEVHRGLEGDGAVTVTAPAVLNGRHAEPGGLFVAFAAEQVDGHDYAGQARGGRTGLPAHSAATVVVQDAQAALQALPTDVVGRLRDGLTIIGLTGCQGKTSVQQLDAVSVRGR